MPKYTSKWDKTKEFHYPQGDVQAGVNAFEACEQFDREFVSQLERINGRPLTYAEKVSGTVNRKDKRTPLAAAQQDLWQPRKAINNSPTAKYDSLIESLSDDTEARYLEAAKIRDFRERTIAFAEIERSKILAKQAEQAAIAELKESPQVKLLQEWREEIKFNGNVDEFEWQAIDIAIRQAEFPGGCPVETAATFEQAKAIRESRIAEHNAAKAAKIAELQAELIAVREGVANE